jgi:hypothetical protein
MKQSKRIRLLAYVTGLINQELVVHNEYLVAENRVLRAHLPTLLRLSDTERSTLAEIGKTARAQGPGPSRVRRQTRYHSGVVPQAVCPQVRWLQTSPVPR